MSDAEFSLTLELTRGTSTDDRDKMKLTVEADDLDELNEKVASLRGEMEDWSDQFRSIQPDSHRSLADDQAELGGVES